MSQSRKEQFHDMLKDFPDDHEIRYFLAMEYVSEENDEEAIKWFEEAIRLNPQYPPAYHMGGRTYARLGKIDEAKAILEKGIAVAQSTGEMHPAGEMSEFLATLEG